MSTENHNEHDHDHHGHGHHDLKASSRRRVRAVFALTFTYMLAEVAGGLWTGSLALLGDATHMLTDAGALGLALLAFRLSERPPSPERSFGLHRAEIIAALLNGVVLLVVAVLVVREGIHRLIEPTPIIGGGMLLIAAVGLVVNLIGGYILIGGDRENLNLRGALFHVAGDALGSVGAIAAAVVIITTGWMKIDPIVSFVIAAIIIVGAIKLIGDSLHIVLESTPRNINLIEVENAIAAHPRVESVHDLHVWTITSGFVSLSAHVVLVCDGDSEPSISDTDIILAELGETLEKEFNITHYAIQFEREPCTSRCCDTCNGNGLHECEPPPSRVGVSPPFETI